MDHSPDRDSDLPVDPGFGPGPNDGRERGEWETRWPPEAWKRIKGEVIVVVLYFGLGLLLTLLVFTERLQSALDLDADRYDTFARYSYACLGGLLGGTLFAMKWLYHSVAKQVWNFDRWVWRVMTPLISMGLAFTMYLLFSSGLLSAFGSETTTQRHSSVMGISILVGYFSDHTIAALVRAADRVLGPHGKEEHPHRPNADPEGRGD